MKRIFIICAIFFATGLLRADWTTYRNAQGRSAYRADVIADAFVLSYFDSANLSTPGMNMSQPVKVGVGCYE